MGNDISVDKLGFRVKDSYSKKKQIAYIPYKLKTLGSIIKDSYI